MRDQKLLKNLKRAVHQENLSTIKVLELINQIEEDGACLRNGYSSIYQYLTKGLLYSEGAAMRRLGAARVVKQYPEVRDLFTTRKVSLCTVSLIAKRVKNGTNGELVSEIVGKSKREVEELLALRDGKNALREVVRPVAVKRAINTGNDSSSQQREAKPQGGLELRKTSQTSSTATAERSSTPPPVFEIEERLKLSFSIKRDDYHLVERAKELLSNRFPKGADLEELFVLGLKEVIAKEEKRIAGLGTRKSRAADPNKRYIPAALRKAVLERDNHQCTYRHRDGTVCGSKWQIETDHIIAHALGGRTELSNLRAVCRNHNQVLAKDAGLGKKVNELCHCEEYIS